LLTVNPGGGGDTVLVPVNDALNIKGTAAELDGTTIGGFNFLPAVPADFGFTTPVTIRITDLAFSGAVTTQLTGETLTVMNGATAVATFFLPDAPGTGSFVAAADGASGTSLSFSPATPGLTVSATLAAGATSFAASPGTTPSPCPPPRSPAARRWTAPAGSTCFTLTGTGLFDLTVPAAVDNFQVLNVGTSQTVMLRPGLSLPILGGGATLIGPASSDPIVLEGFDSGNTVVVGSPWRRSSMAAGSPVPLLGVGIHHRRNDLRRA